MKQFLYWSTLLNVKICGIILLTLKAYGIDEIPWELVLATLLGPISVVALFGIRLKGD